MHIGHAAPQAVTGFRIQFLQPTKDVLHLRPVGGGFIGTVLHLFPVAPQGCQFLQIGFVHQTERTNEGHVELVHHQLGRHAAECALEGDVHQQSLKDVVHVMPQGNLVASVLLGYGKECLAPVPRTKEAGRLARVGRGVKRSLIMDKGDSQPFTVRLQIIQVSAVGNVRHTDMHRHERETRLVDARAQRQQFKQRHGVFSSRQSHENLVIIFNQSILHHALGKTLVDAAQEFGFIRTISVYGAAVLSLLEQTEYKNDDEWFARLIKDVRVEASFYPDFLQPHLSMENELTATELQILRLICADKSNAQIGQIMDIKLPTVKTHVSHILTKLDVSRRSEAKTAAKRLWLIQDGKN